VLSRPFLVLETKTETLAIRSRDQDRDLGLQVSGGARTSRQPGHFQVSTVVKQVWIMYLTIDLMSLYPRAFGTLKRQKLRTLRRPEGEASLWWLVRRSEFPAGQLAGSWYSREQFQTISEDVSVRYVLMHSAH